MQSINHLWSSFLLIINYKITVKQLNIKGRTYYFHNDLTNIVNVETNDLKLDKKHHWGLICIVLVMLIKNLNGMLIL